MKIAANDILPTLDILASARNVADNKADQTVNELFKTADPAKWLKEIAEIDKNNTPIPDHWPEFLKEYFNDTSALPIWASKRKMQLATEFFNKNCQHIMLNLILLSLPYCYAAATDAEVLLHSQRIGSDTRKRLAETGQFIYDVFDYEGFGPNGKAICSTQKVRLMHAVVRYHLIKQRLWDSQNGKPINQEALAGTNLAFSLMIIRGMNKLNIKISNDQEDAYLHLWNIVSYIMGIDEKLIYHQRKNIILLERLIRERQFKESQTGYELTKALINTAKDFFPGQSPDNYLLPLMHHLLGDEIAKMLGIPVGNKSDSLITLFKIKNTFEGVFNIYSGKVNWTIKKQLLIETDMKAADFKAVESIPSART